jgi:hypothetical protein
MQDIESLRHPDSSGLLTTIAALAPLLLHAQFEAWWFGVGSVALPLFLIFFLWPYLQNIS